MRNRTELSRLPVRSGNGVADDTSRSLGAASDPGTIAAGTVAPMIRRQARFACEIRAFRRSLLLCALLPSKSMELFPRQPDDKSNPEPGDSSKYPGRNDHAEEIPESTREIPRVELRGEQLPREWSRPKKSQQKPAVCCEILDRGAPKLVVLGLHQMKFGWLNANCVMSSQRANDLVVPLSGRALLRSISR